MNNTTAPMIFSKKAQEQKQIARDGTAFFEALVNAPPQIVFEYVKEWNCVAADFALEALVALQDDEGENQ